MQKSCVKIILKNQIRIYLSDCKEVVQSIFDRHNYLPFPNLILANAICAFTPLKFLYDSPNLMIKLKTNGPINSLFVEVKDLSIRALISNPNVETEYDKTNYNDIPLILGIGDSGILQVSKVIKNETFVSDVPLARADIVSDVAYYLNHSDQIFSAVLNNVKLDEKNANKIKVANNVIFQLLPNHSEDDIQWIETFIKNHDFSNCSLEEYQELIGGILYEIKEINANCWCDKKRVIQAIKSLNEEEKKQIFIEDESVETKCDFCNQKFIISKEDI